MWLLNAASIIVIGKFNLDTDEGLVFSRDVKVEYDDFLQRYRQLIEKIDKSRFESNATPSLDALISGLACFIHHLNSDTTSYDPHRLIQHFIVLIMMCIEQHHPTYLFEAYECVVANGNQWMADLYDAHLERVKKNYLVTEKIFKKIYAYIITEKDIFYNLLKMSNSRYKHFLATETKRKDNHHWCIKTALASIDNVIEFSQRSQVWLESEMRKDLDEIQEKILNISGNTIPYNGCVIPIEIMLEALSNFFYQLEAIKSQYSDIKKEKILHIFHCSIIVALMQTNVAHTFKFQLRDFVDEDEVTRIESEIAEHGTVALTPERALLICKFIPINEQLQLHNLLRYTKQPNSLILPHLPLPRHQDWYINAAIWKIQQTFPALKNKRMSRTAILIKLAVLMEIIVNAVVQNIQEDNEFYGLPGEEHDNIFSIDVTASLVSQFNKRLCMMPKNHEFNYDEVATIFLSALLLNIKYKYRHTRSENVIHLINDSLRKDNRKFELEHFEKMNFNLTFKIRHLRDFYKSLPESNPIKSQLMRCLKKTNNPTNKLLIEYLETVIKCEMRNDLTNIPATYNQRRLRKKEKNRKRKLEKVLENELEKAFEDKLTELWSIREDTPSSVRKPPRPAKVEVETSQAKDSVYKTPNLLFNERGRRDATVVVASEIKLR